ncbi:MAG: hypothetical protein AAFO89_07605 [Planctomycetota bacterium]
MANAVYDPIRDELLLDDGTAKANYFRDDLGIRYYEALDKTNVPIAPSGWCSWYYFYQEISADQVMENAEWAAQHLKDYGLHYIQIDDGWQGTGRGLGDNRDFFAIDDRFEETGMDGLADGITDLGFEAGIWLVPFGQSNPDAVSDASLLKNSDGTFVSHEWVGDFMLDPTIEATADYLRSLFRTYRDMGYTYFKTDGFPPTIDVFAGNIGAMAAPGYDELDDRERAEQLFRDGIEPIREAIGDESYWLGCWGTETTPIGITDGGRTAGDVRVTHEGYLYAKHAILKWAFLHNIAWFSDPDVVLARPPLSDAVARSWITALGITGQALLLSDNLPMLPESRVDMLRRALPATDVRALDLYRHTNLSKPIWTLYAHRPDAAQTPYTVVAVFNESEERTDSRLVRWEDLGLSGSAPHHAYDFWRDEYLGAWDHGMFLEVPPGDVRLIALAPMDEQKPVLLSTSRHVTQGWVDLETIDTRELGDGRWQVSGRSAVVGGDEYTLTFGTPRGAGTLRMSAFEAIDAQGDAVEASRSRQYSSATATLDPKETGSIEWRATFERADADLSHPVRPEREILVTQIDDSTVRASVAIQWSPSAGFLIELDGEPLGYTAATAVLLRDLEPGKTYTVSQRPVWYDGTVASDAVSQTFTLE